MTEENTEEITVANKVLKFLKQQGGNTTQTEISAYLGNNIAGLANVLEYLVEHDLVGTDIDSPHGRSKTVYYAKSNNPDKNTNMACPHCRRPYEDMDLFKVMSLTEASQKLGLSRKTLHQIHKKHLAGEGDEPPFKIEKIGSHYYVKEVALKLMGLNNEVIKLLGLEDDKQVQVTEW